jgi:hypothetical protein
MTMESSITVFSIFCYIENTQGHKHCIFWVIAPCSPYMNRRFGRKYHLHLQGRRPPLWSSGRSSWLQIQGSVLDSRRYQIFWEVLDLERGPLSLVSTIEELLGRKSSGSGLDIREYGRRDPSRWQHDILYPQMLALVSPTSGGHSVGLIR